MAGSEGRGFNPADELNKKWASAPEASFFQSGPGKSAIAISLAQIRRGND
jgi:hypothetical protein